MLLLLHHHFESGDQDPPGHDSRPELIEHVLVDVVGEVESLALSREVSLVEAERLLSLLGASSRGFLVLLATMVFFVQDVLVAGLRC